MSASASASSDCLSIYGLSLSEVEDCTVSSTVVVSSVEVVFSSTAIWSSSSLAVVESEAEIVVSSDTDESLDAEAASKVES